jgi:restriction system protein
MPKYYRVSAGKNAKYLEEAVRDGFVGVGWLTDTDLTAEFPDDWRAFNAKYIPLVKERDAITSNVAAGLACGAMWTVCHAISEGDVVLTSTGKSSYRVGTVTGPYRYAKGQNLPHRRPVAWRAEVLQREDLSEALRHSLGSIGTVAALRDYDDELGRMVRGEPEPEVSVSDQDVEDPLSFVLERHLEDFLVSNWKNTVLGRDYDLYVVDGEVVGQQYPSDTGPIDILAHKKDGSEVLVIELKRGRVSDVVVGQILRYMGFVQELEPEKKVRGLIIGLEDDPRLTRALSMTPSVTFMRYEVKFQLHPPGA